MEDEATVHERLAEVDPNTEEYEHLAYVASLEESLGIPIPSQEAIIKAIRNMASLVKSKRR